MNSTSAQDARALARAAVRNSLPAQRWQANEAFTRTLCRELEQHRFARHPLIGEMGHGPVPFDWLRNFYLDTVQAVSGPFMEYVLQAVVNCSQVQDQVGLRGVAAARFLMSINAMDELGFEPGSADGGFLGDPARAHAVQLFDTMEQMGITQEDVRDHGASPPARAMAAMLERNRHDHLRLAVVLAAYESTLAPWSGAWAEATRNATSVDVDRGYHAIHVEDEHGDAVDDEHSEDSWHIVRQALGPGREAEVRALALELMDVCATYVDYQQGLLREAAVAQD
jgi:hypothetical protein